MTKNETPFITEELVEDHLPDLYRYDAVAESVDGIESVTDEQIQFFHEQGYLVVHNLLQSLEIEAGRQGVWDLVDGKREDFRGIHIEAAARGKTDALSPLERRNAVRKLFRFIDYDARLKTLAEHPNILSILTRILGEPPVLFQDMALLKPPLIGREKPWHQDCAYFNFPIDATVVGVWIALDEATPENGCLHIVPGSHREGPMLHFRRRDWQICDTDALVDRDAMVPLKPGGCLFWHGLTHHGSPSNHTNSRRRALQFHYKPASCPEIPKDERLAIYGGEVQGAQC